MNSTEITDTVENVTQFDLETIFSSMATNELDGATVFEMNVSYSDINITTPLRINETFAFTTMASFINNLTLNTTREILTMNTTESVTVPVKITHPDFLNSSQMTSIDSSAKYQLASMKRKSELKRSIWFFIRRLHFSEWEMIELLIIPR